jgi:hypothetical protein
MTEVKTDNEIIAEFMGAVRRDNGYINIPIPETGIIISNTCFKFIDELKCYQTWDWLMPVVGNITETKPMNQAWYDVKYHLLDANIKVVYQRVVEFIKWHNQQSNAPVDYKGKV